MSPTLLFVPVNLSGHLQGNCHRNNSYGFKDGRPCILIKLNRIIGWEPKPYEPESLPSDLPQHLQEEIKKNKEEDKANLVSSNLVLERDNVGVSLTLWSRVLLSDRDKLLI